MYCRPLLIACVAGCAAASTQSASDANRDAPGDARIDTPDSACATQLSTLGTGFENGTEGWSHAVLDNASAPGWPLDEWQQGAATSGPSGCHGGTGCWGTRLDANYTSCQRAALVSPAIDLSSCAGQSVTLTFWSWHDFWTGTVSGKAQTWFDGGMVEVSADGSTWTEVSPSPSYPGTIAINPNISTYECVSSASFHVNAKAGLVGASNGWQMISVPLPAAVVGATFQVRFSYGSGVSYANSDPEVDRGHTRPGWYLDDIAFAAQ